MDVKWGFMKIRCTKCNIEEDICEDDVKLLAHVVKKYNSNPSPMDYISVLQVIKGNSCNGGKHEYVFDKSFDKEVSKTITEYSDAIAKNVENKVALEKIENQIIDMKNVLKEIEKKKDYALAELNAESILIEGLKLKFLKLTGMEDFEIWRNRLIE